MKEVLISCNGCIFRRLNNTRGYTLLEVIASIAISTIVLTMGFTLVISLYRNYLDMVNISVRQNEIDNALLSIDRMLTGKMMIDLNCNISKNEIAIDYISTVEPGRMNVKKIKRNNEKLSVETYKLDQLKQVLLATNTILEKVRDFEVLKKGNVYYYKITLTTGDVIIQCI